jgi:glycosyltransferase involved in cell wall biosynthesis
MLVPHEPQRDPRVGWVTSFCRQIARTDILSLDSAPKGLAVEYDGQVSIERGDLAQYMTGSLTRLSRWANQIHSYDLVKRFLEMQGGTDQKEPTTPATRPGWRHLADLARERGKYHVGGIARGLSHVLCLQCLAEAIWRRARAISVRPALIICHDFWTLIAGIRLKKRYGCPVIYDAHEYTPEADIVAHPAEAWFWKVYERRLARQADALVSVTPQLVREFKRLYGLRRVCCAPNAAPLSVPGAPSSDRAPGYPVKFLLQGMACPGRGFETLLSAWRQLADPRAVLHIRCPEWSYMQQLRETYADLVAKGLLQFLPAVDEAHMVDAATFADVGVIPYPVKVANRERNLNHLYCCPNKLSQYMQAGLAVLSTNSVFLSDRLRHYGCGLAYDAERPETLIQAVTSIIGDLSRLQRMKANASHWAREDFHWDKQSAEYEQLANELFQTGAAVYRRAAA